MEYQFKADDVDDLEDIAVKVSKLIESEGVDIVLLYGGMGSGKTTFVRELCQVMEVVDSVTSPTFALVNEYERECGGMIFHFDFYRINKLEEVFDLGYEEYLYSGNLSLIEWPELVEPIIPYDDPSIKIARMNIEILGTEKRKFRFTI